MCHTSRAGESTHMPNVSCLQHNAAGRQASHSLSGEAQLRFCAWHNRRGRSHGAELKQHVAGVQAGNVAQQEMFRTFNMGIGMVVVVDEMHVEAALAHDQHACLLGKVVKGEGVRM